MKKYWDRFVHDEDGSELMQWAIIIIICVSLAVIAYAIYDSVAGQLQDAKDQIDGLGGVSGGAGGTSSTLTPP